MTAGRMMTALGALALGLATAGAVPALAQGGTATTTAATPSHSNTGTPAMNTTQATGTNEQMNSTAGTAHNPAAPTGTNTAAGTSTPAPGNAPLTTGQAGSSGTTAGTEPAHGTAHGMNAQNAPRHMNTKSSSTAMTHHPMEHRRMARSSSHINNANPNAQNGEVARLNEQSLQAAQQGKTFTPSSNM